MHRFRTPHNRILSHAFSQFAIYAEEITLAAETNIGEVLHSLESISLAYTAHAHDTQSNWPNVTLPHFQVLAQNAIEQSGSEAIAFTPFVPEEMQTQWEAYATAVNPALPPTIIHISDDDGLEEEGEEEEEEDSSDDIDFDAFTPVCQLEPPFAGADMFDLLSLTWFKFLASDGESHCAARALFVWLRSSHS